MNDYIGRVVRVFESGNKGSLSVGQSGVDCGCSFGTYQFVLRYGVVIDFLKRFFPEEAKNLYYNGPDVASQEWPGKDYSSSPDDVKKVWLKCYEKAGAEQFFYYEHEQIKDICYLPCKAQIQKKLGLDVDNVSRAFQEAVWSGSVHFGAVTAANMLLTAIEEIGNDWGARQEETFNKFYEKRYEVTGYERYKTGIYNGNSEVETLRPYLTITPLKNEESEEKKMKKVMIDPGHYGSYYNQSPVNPAYYESNFTWELALKIGAYLKQFGFDAALTRDKKDSDPGLVERGNMAVGYDLFLSVHSNGVADNAMNRREEIDYPVAYCMVDDNRFSFDEVSREIGLKLAQGVQEVLQTKQKAEVYLWRADWDRDGNGMLDDNYLGVLHGARLAGVPGVVLEHSFHTNTAMTNKLLQESYVEALAKKDAEVIAEFFGMYKKPSVQMTSFGLCDNTVSVTADNIPLYKDASMYNQVGTLKKNENWRAVQSYSLSDGRKGFRLETGYYINGEQGIKVTKNQMPKTVKAVNSPDGMLNVRDFPNSNGGSVLYQLRNDNLFDVIGECYNNGDHWLLAHIKNENVDITGFVSAKYAK